MQAGWIGIGWRGIKNNGRSRILRKFHPFLPAHGVGRHQPAATVISGGCKVVGERRGSIRGRQRVDEIRLAAGIAIGKSRSDADLIRDLRQLARTIVLERGEPPKGISHLSNFVNIVGQPVGQRRHLPDGIGHGHQPVGGIVGESEGVPRRILQPGHINMARAIGAVRLRKNPHGTIGIDTLIAATR